MLLDSYNYIAAMYAEVWWFLAYTIYIIYIARSLHVAVHIHCSHLPAQPRFGVQSIGDGTHGSAMAGAAMAAPVFGRNFILPEFFTVITTQLLTYHNYEIPMSNKYRYHTDEFEWWTKRLLERESLFEREILDTCKACAFFFNSHYTLKFLSMPMQSGPNLRVSHTR